MNRQLRIFGLLTSLSFAFALTLAGGCTQAVPPSPAGGIHVYGQGTLELEPDMGRVQFHVRREGSEADVLTAELNRVVATVIDLAKQFGIEERDIQATSLSITPRYQRRGDETVVDGLIATRSIDLLLKDLSVFPALLGEALASGVNNVDPIRLDSSERTAREDEALTLAMEDAKAEAARVAAGFDVQLGPVSDVQVGAHSPRPEAAMRAVAFADGGGGFNTGVIRIERSVNVTFSIRPGG